MNLSGNGAPCARKRSEMWGWMRAWLQGAAISDDPEPLPELAMPSFGHNARGEIQLKRIDDTRKLGLSSPDCADAPALTFA